jgi:hypothetical protein
MGTGAGAAVTVGAPYGSIVASCRAIATGVMGEYGGACGGEPGAPEPSLELASGRVGAVICSGGSVGGRDMVERGGRPLEEKNLGEKVVGWWGGGRDRKCCWFRIGGVEAA